MRSKKYKNAIQKANDFVNFSESSDNYKWSGNFAFHWLLIRIVKFSGKSIRTEINGSMITYLSLCTASTGRSTSLNEQPRGGTSYICIRRCVYGG